MIALTFCQFSDFTTACAAELFASQSTKFARGELASANGATRQQSVAGEGRLAIPVLRQGGCCAAHCTAASALICQHNLKCIQEM